MKSYPNGFMPMYVHRTNCLTELLYPLQNGNTPLHCTAMGGHTTCVERLLSTPGIDVNNANRVSWSIECKELSIIINRQEQFNMMCSCLRAMSSL